MTNQRGGYRKHAGRPAGTTKPDKRQLITIRLPPDLIEVLKEMPSKGRFIEAAIRAALKQETGEQI